MTQPRRRRDDGRKNASTTTQEHGGGDTRARHALATLNNPTADRCRKPSQALPRRRRPTLGHALRLSRTTIMIGLQPPALANGEALVGSPPRRVPHPVLHTGPFRYAPCDRATGGEPLRETPSASPAGIRPPGQPSVGVASREAFLRTRVEFETRPRQPLGLGGGRYPISCLSLQVRMKTILASTQSMRWCNALLRGPANQETVDTAAS